MNNYTVQRVQRSVKLTPWYEVYFQGLLIGLIFVALFLNLFK